MPMYTANQRFVLSLGGLLAASIWGLSLLTHSLATVGAQPANPGIGDNRPTANGDNTPSPSTLTPTTGLRIGFVNMGEVVQNYPRTWKELEKIGAYSEEQKKKLMEEERGILNMRDEISRSGGDVPNAKFEEFIRRTKQFELDKRAVQHELTSKLQALSKVVYLEVYQEIDAVKQGRYDLILNVMEREIRVGSEEEFVSKISLRGVVLYDAKDEITVEVQKRLEELALKKGYVTEKDLKERAEKMKKIK